MSMTEWRRTRDAGTLGAKRSPRTRGEKREIEKLLKKDQRLEDELDADAIGPRYCAKNSRALEEALQERGQRVVVEELLDADTAALIALVGVKNACELLGRVLSKQLSFSWKRCLNAPGSRTAVFKIPKRTSI